MHRHPDHVVGDVAQRRLVEVVADARAVGEQVLDGHGIVDQRQVVPSTDRAVVSSDSDPATISAIAVEAP